MSTRVDTGNASRRAREAALRWLTRVATVAVVAAVTLWVHLYEFNRPNTWDAAQLLTMGKLLQRGLLLYRDVWEMKPPGIFLYQRAVFSVLPVAPWSLRLVDFALYVVAGVLFFRLCAVEARWPLALAGTAAWIYFAHHPDFNNQGFYTEEYASMSAIAAVAAAARYCRGGGLGWVAVSGVAVAGAVLFKHPGVACAVPVAVLISARRPLRALPLVVACAALPLLLVIGYFWWRGALAEFVDCNFLVLLVYGRIAQSGAPGPAARLSELGLRTWERFAPYPELLWPVAFGGAVCLQRPNRFRLAALSWLVADLIMIAAQSRYYEHYFIQLFASAILVGTLGAAWLLQRRPGDRWFAAAVRAVLCVVVVALAWPRLQVVIAQRQPAVTGAWAALRAGPSAWLDHPGGDFEADIGRYLKERTAPDDRVFVYANGTGTAIYWTADRLPASRYLYPNASQLSLAREAEQRAELERTRPAYIVVAGDPIEHHFTPLLLAHYSLAAVKSRDYRVEIWARNEIAHFAVGRLAGLAEDPQQGGLVLAAPAGAASRLPAELADTRRGAWISPVVEVVGGGDLMLDWSARGDPAGDPTGVGLLSDDPSAARGPGIGMGVAVRYRSGPTPDLSESPWIAAQDGERPQVLRAQRYVQIQCDMWSRYDGRSPLLRSLQIGRLRFQLGGDTTAPGAPLRTARQPTPIAPLA